MAENYFGITDTGRIRDNNEDAFIAEPVMNGKMIAACVIDGVGGYEGGEVAASIARETILQTINNGRGAGTALLKQSLVETNRNISTAKFEGHSNPNMACVVTLALADPKENKFYYAHVGDTRLYLFRDRSLVKITRDQSFVGFLEDSGRLTEEEAMNHPKRNEINKALGFDGQLQNDYIDVGESPFLPGDLLLLCSDGLSDLVKSEEIIRILSSQDELEQKAVALVNAANDAGGKDNITIVLLRNSKKPARQKATKPVLIKKNSSRPVEVQKGEAEKPAEPPAKKKQRSWLPVVILLSLLCVISIGTSVWLFREHFVQSGSSPAVMAERNENERSLQDSLDKNASGLLVLHHAVFGDTVKLTAPLFINSDSFRLTGPVVFLKDSSFAAGGPAIKLGVQCRQLHLDSISFSGFNLAIETFDPSILRMNHVNFYNTRLSVAQAIRDSSATFTDPVPAIKKDSIKTILYP